MAALLQRLFVLLDQQVQVVVLRLAGCGGRRRLAVGAEFPFVTLGGAQVLAAPGVQQHFFQGRVGIVADLDLVAPQAAVADAEETALQLHVAVLAVDGPLDAPQEKLQRPLQVDLPRERLALLVTLLRRLAGFRMRALVVADVQPGGEGPVETVQGEEVSRADLGFELRLAGLEEAFDQPPRRRVARRPVQQLDVQGQTGGLQGVGVVDFGVVHVQFATGPAGRPSAQQGVDQDVQRLPVIIPPGRHITAVTVDERRQVRADRPVLVQHVGTFLEVADPQLVGLLASPAAADLGCREAQFQTRGAGLLQVPVQGGLGELLAELCLEELVDRLVGTQRLVLL